jgi:hypothetical protein
MDIGMLWFDNDQQASVPSKVERAARYYQKKYGKLPNLCYIHPTMMKVEREGKREAQPKTDQEPLKIGQILVLLNEKILPDHYWIGISTADDPISSGA